jgi:hypothetical protein
VDGDKLRDMKSVKSILEQLGAGVPKPPRAVIIKGNPAYIENNPKADAFYAELERLVRAAGYDPVFDAGEPNTSPDENAALWIGHSRGVDRLRFAPPGVKTLAVDQFEDGYAEREAENNRLMQAAGYKSWSEWPLAKRPLPHDNHYKVTDALRAAIRDISETNKQISTQGEMPNNHK